MCSSKQVTIPPVGSLSLLVLVLLSSTFPAQALKAQGRGRGGTGAQRQQNNQQQGKQQQGNSLNRQMGSGGNSVQGGSLSQVQLEQLISMREEERLAHDVYIALARSSGLGIFDNIAQAESKHMRAVEQLLSRYAPVASMPKLPAGTFANPETQRLYTVLVATGSASPVAALTVGAKIEEMDIRDLQQLLAQNPPQQVARVLGNLQRASANHLRAFMGQLQDLGGSYTPEFLDRQVFDSIVSSDSPNGAARNNMAAASDRSGKQRKQGKGNRGAIR